MTPLQEAYRYCHWITHHHYENFPVASWLLPKKMRPHVAAIYAFTRSADDFADEARYQGRSLELLDLWKRALWACTNGAGQGLANGLSSHPIFLALADTVSRYDLPVQLLDDLLSAFRMDVTKRRYSDWEDLLTYCRYSANPVGRLVLLLFGIRDPQLHAYSDRICTALQLANHWQDLRIDVDRDILYVPKTLLEQHGVGEGELKDWKNQVPSAPFRSLMKDLVERTRILFDEGEKLIPALSGGQGSLVSPPLATAGGQGSLVSLRPATARGLKFEIKCTLLGGRSILDRVVSADYDVFRHRPVLSSTTKFQLLAHAFSSR